MSFLAGSAISTLELDANPFTRGLLQSQAMMQLFPSWVTSFLADPILGWAELAKSAIGVVREAFNASLGRADQIHDLALMAGTTAEELSGFGFAAQQSGASVEALAQGIRFLNDNMKDAARGNKTMVAEFEDAGVRFTDLEGNLRSPIQVMLDLADAIAATEDAGSRTKWAQLMGRAGTELIPTLRGGRAEMEALRKSSDDLGRTITTSAAKSADAFGDLQGEMAASWEGIQNAIGEPLRDELTPLLQSWVNWTKSSSPEIRAELRNIVATASDTATGIMSLMRAVKLVWDVTLGPVLEKLGQASDIVAQLTLGNRADVNSVTATRTAEDARRDRDAGNKTINVQINDDRASTGELADAVAKGLRENRQAVQRQDIDRRRRARELG